jgi:hypothetical protein
MIIITDDNFSVDYDQITFFIACEKTKQWPLAPNSREWRITRVNVARRVTFFSKMAFGECRRVWRVLSKWFDECWRVWRVRTTRLGECWQVW